jgi:hypothetical protein
MCTRHADSSARVPAGKSFGRGPSQHAAAEKGVIQRQSDDCAYCGYAGAVNAMDIEASQPVAPDKGEKLAADNRANDAEQYIDDGSFACGADDLASDQPEY